MALLSAFNIIRIIALLHVTIAYYLLFDPRIVAEQNLTMILANSMDVPHTSDFNRATPVTAFAALVLGFLGLSDLIAVSINEPVAIEYWSAVTPLRLIVLFPLTAYLFLHQPEHFSSTRTRFGAAKPADLLKNSFTFTWCFLETMLWFWVYVSLREQRAAAVKRVLKAKGVAQ